MKGVGGPLLCIGDLLCDVGEEGEGITGGFQQLNDTNTFPHLQVSDSEILLPTNLKKTFQENYDQLDNALASTDQSWTALTLKLCSALDSANRLVQFINLQVGELTEKVVGLEKAVDRSNSAVAEAKSIQASLNKVGAREDKSSFSGKELDMKSAMEDYTKILS